LRLASRYFSRSRAKGQRRRKRVWTAVCFLILAIVAGAVYFRFYRHQGSLSYGSSQTVGHILYPSYPNSEGLEAKVEGPQRSLLLITVDTLRPDYLGFNGYDLKATPSIDRLISESLYFAKAVTPIPRTTQALACLLTGQYPYKTGVRRLWDELSRQTITLAEILKKAGYRTIAVVSNHILVPQRRLDRGFQVYDFATDKRDALKTSEAAVQHLDELDGKRPFFLWVHYIDPHVPYYPPEGLAREVDPHYEGRYKTHFGGKPGAIGEHAYPKDIGKERAVFHNDLGEEVNRHIRRLYAADIQFTDMGIHSLLEAVERRASDDVVIVFTADHGESLGEHDYYFDHGDYVYSAGLRIPLSFKLPSNHPLHQVGRVDSWVSLVDVLPTILDLLAVDVRSGRLENIDGRSLAACWKGKSLERVPVFAESDDSFYPKSIKRRVRFDISGRFRCVIRDEWKLIWTPFQTGEMLYEFYHLESDPHEKNDEYRPDHPQARVLLEQLQQWMAQQPQGVREPVPGKRDIETLRSLGYIR
jgi:arylsulfatase A-like enzyme